MKNRFRIEIYDDVKQNDMTIFSDTKVDKDQLSEIVFGQLRNFQGNVRAFVYDNLKKRKVTALILPMEVVTKHKPRQLTKIELGLI